MPTIGQNMSKKYLVGRNTPHKQTNTNSNNILYIMYRHQKLVLNIKGVGLSWPFGYIDLLKMKGDLMGYLLTIQPP